MKPNKQVSMEKRWHSSTFIPGSHLIEQQSTLLALLHSSLVDPVDLAPLIRELSREYPGNYAYKLRRLARLIEQDVPWVDALEQTPGALPADSVLALRIGQQSGISNATLEQLRMDNAEDLLCREKSHWKSYLSYWLSVSFVMTVIYGAFTNLILPTIRRMMEEFGIEQSLMKLELVERYSVFPFLTALVLICSGLLLNWSESFRTWLLNLLRIRTDSSTKKQATLLNILANTTKHGRPMSGALSTLAKFHGDPDMRKRLLVARNEIEQGTEPWESLNSVGLITQLQKETLQGQSNENQAWILRTLARSLRAHEQFRWGWLTAIVQPLILIVFGLSVLGLSSTILDGLYSIVSELAKDTRWR